MDLSIIIPVFNESKKIAVDIEAAGEFLKANQLSGEIIVADDCHINPHKTAQLRRTVVIAEFTTAVTLISQKQTCTSPQFELWLVRPDMAIINIITKRLHSPVLSAICLLPLVLFLRCICITVISAGVIPPIRDTWPSVSGRNAESFSLASARRCNI